MNPLSGVGSVYTPSTQAINPPNAVNVLSATVTQAPQTAPAAGTDYSPAFSVEISAEGLAANTASTA